MAERIYMDNQSTTPPDPRVVDAMRPFQTGRFGHPASRGHAFGWDAEKAVEAARAQVADLIHGEPPEIVFTSGGTEADNLAVKGVAEALAGVGRHIVTTSMENRPVRDSCAWLAGHGWEVTLVPPDPGGRIDPAAIADCLREDTALLSVQYANHEVGTVQDLAAIGQIAAEHNVWLHSDATHAVAWLPVDVQALGIHLLSLSAHRMYGPMGVGALYARRRKPRVRLVPQMHGGGHERGLRAGTVNVAGVVGLGAAAALCQLEHEADAQRISALRDRLEGALLARIDDVRVVGDRTWRLPNNATLSFAGVEGEALLIALPDIALATGSACTSATAEPSLVLRALGLDGPTADATVRFSLGRFTTEAEIERAILRVQEAVARTRALGTT